jgi:ribosomal protein S18 acetylase RimI-like enzyme
MSALIRKFEFQDLEEVRAIFFESSTKKTFKDSEEKEAFFYKYVGFYLKHWPYLAVVAVADKVLGYVVTAPETQGQELMNLQPHLKIFQHLFLDYPAHLHINCHVDSRGQGVGGKLMLEAITLLKMQYIKGLHIMTGPDSPNQSFYKKLGFTFLEEQNFQGVSILFMGKSLS